MAASEAVVLCGGLGTRLRSVSGSKPKALVDIAGRPFLEVVLAQLLRAGVGRVILATGYGHELVQAHFGHRWRQVDVVYSREREPLGTGGALAQALGSASTDPVLVVNGDTYFDVDLGALADFHVAREAAVTLALKRLAGFDRYGTVELTGDRVVAFHEKRPCDEGLINGGIYVLGRDLFAGEGLASAFSFERDFLERRLASRNVCGMEHDGYFIDIGVPEDYARACKDLSASDTAARSPS
jgi:D-glycero-alpha-D-manno-heptose 1-phosphate guanylyltransferase